MTAQADQNDITQLLIKLTDGDEAVLDSLLPLICDELRQLAGRYLRRERRDHTLQPTALVHEAYLNLVDQTQMRWQNRAHFFGVAALVMRRILVEHARRHTAQKRGGDADLVPLEEELLIVPGAAKSVQLLALDAQKSKIVELRYFGGLSVEETTEVMGVAPITIKRQWRMAKAWLYGQIAPQQ